MGGFGSGERLRKKRTVEGCRDIDTADFRRRGWFESPGTRSGDLTWGAAGGGPPAAVVGYVLGVDEAAGSIRLRYAFGGDPTAAIEYRVLLEATPCRFGGRRWWFRCPLSRDGVPCGRRVRKVYLAGRYFGCRHCHDLTYKSRQQSDARVYALTRGGLDALTGCDDLSISELGIGLKAGTILQLRLNRPTGGS